VEEDEPEAVNQPAKGQLKPARGDKEPGHKNHAAGMIKQVYNGAGDSFSGYRKTLCGDGTSLRHGAGSLKELGSDWPGRTTLTCTPLCRAVRGAGEVVKASRKALEAE